MTAFTAQFYGGFCIAILVLVVLEARHKSLPRASSNDDYRKFQSKYLLVYFLAMLADWLQGPYLYRLYEEYGFLHEQIAALYMVGYGTAMIAGPLMGGLADRHGRKKMSMLFCGIYAASCLCKLSPSFLFLVLGRFFSGISTALLTSTFESWMLAEHDRMGFPSDWLPRIFGLATFGNGVVAVLAGVLAHVAADCCGHAPSRPFLLAVVVLAITAATINNTWDENRPPEEELLVAGPAMADRLGSALRPILRTRKIWLLGTVQALFEGAVYTFVFLWTPSIDAAEQRAHELDHPPLGIVFGSFMLAMMLGSTLFRVAVAQQHTIVECLKWSLLLAATVLGVAAFVNNVFILFLCFFLFEVACGIFYPSIATLRGEILPEATRAGIMGWFRVPLNLIVIVTMLMVNAASNGAMLGVCSVLCIGAFVAHRSLTAELMKEKLAELQAAGQGSSSLTATSGLPCTSAAATAAAATTAADNV